MPEVKLRIIASMSVLVLEFHRRCFRSYLASASRLFSAYSRALAMSSWLSPARIPIHAALNWALQSSRSLPLPLALAPGLPCTEQFHDHCARLGWYAAGLHDPANRHAAPDHGVIVVVALARNHGGAKCDGFVVGHALPTTCAPPDCAMVNLPKSLLQSHHIKPNRQP